MNPISHRIQCRLEFAAPWSMDPRLATTLLVPRRSPWRRAEVFGAATGTVGELEIHLALESVHFCNLHFQFVAKLDHPAGAAANQLGAGGIELIKVVA